MKRSMWTWLEGKVNKEAAHIEIRYGKLTDSGWEGWLPIALVSPPKGREFTVELLIDPEDSQNNDPVNALMKELDFYLIHENAKDQWAYILYHCGTAANMYSNVHWSHISKVPQGKQKGGVGMDTKKESWLWPILKSVVEENEKTLDSWRRHFPTRQGRIKNFENWLLVEMVHRLLKSPDVKIVKTNGHLNVVRKVLVKDVVTFCDDKLRGTKSKANTLSADISVLRCKEPLEVSAEIKTGLSQIEIMDDLLIVRYYNSRHISDQAEFGWVVLLPEDEEKAKSSRKTYERTHQKIKAKFPDFELLRSDESHNKWLLCCVAVPKCESACNNDPPLS